MSFKNIIYFVLLSHLVLFAQSDDLPKIAVIMPEGEAFEQVLTGLTEELEDEYKLEKVLLNSDDPEANVEKLQSIQPNLIVMMENRSIPVIEKYQSKSENDKTPILAVMALQVEKSVAKLKNVAGIKYEVPAYTIFSNLKIISDESVKKIGVFYNKDFQAYIDLSKKMIAKENIELNSYCVDCEVDGSDSKKAKYMRKKFKKALKDDVDVWWMLADNRLLTPKIFKSFWLKSVGKKKVPVVVPVEPLVGPDVSIGLAMFSPDFLELGTQTAGKIREVIEDETPIDELGFEELISVNSIFNSKKASKIDWDLSNEGLKRAKKVY